MLTRRKVCSPIYVNTAERARQDMLKARKQILHIEGD